MADLETQDDELVLGEEDRVDDQQQDAPEQREEEELELPTFGDDLSEESAADTPLIRQLREQLRDAHAEKKRLAEQLQPKPKVEVGPKPTLESCEWDEAKFEQELDAWKDRKRAVEQESSTAQEQETKRAADLAKAVQGYYAKKDALPYKDKDEMEATAFAAMDDPQKEILIRIAGDPAKLAYALGRNPAKLAALSTIKVNDMASVASFSAAVAKLDGELKMAKRKPAAEPDRPIKSSGSLASDGGDKQAEKLLKEGQQKNDLTAYREYMRSKRKAA
jgi:hypothetical protein